VTNPSGGWIAEYMGDGEPPSRVTALRELVEIMKRDLASETDPHAIAAARRGIEDAERKIRRLEGEQS